VVATAGMVVGPESMSYYANHVCVGQHAGFDGSGATEGHRP
jgi:hypothetical protein